MTFSEVRDAALLNTPRKVKRAERRRWIAAINEAQAAHLTAPTWFAPLSLLRAFGIVVARRVL